MTATVHAARATLRTREPAWHRVSDQPVWVDTFEGGDTSQWEPYTDGGTEADPPTMRAFYNDTARRYEVMVTPPDHGNLATLAMGLHVTLNALTVGTTYEFVAELYQVAGTAPQQILQGWVGAGAEGVVDIASVLGVPAPQVVTVRFTASGTNAQMYVEGHSIEHDDPAEDFPAPWVMTYAALYELTATPYVDLAPTEVRVTLDESWSPYATAQLVCPLPSASALDLIDPRGVPPRVNLTLTRSGGRSLTAADLTDMLALDLPRRVNEIGNPRPTGPDENFYDAWLVVPGDHATDALLTDPGAFPPSGVTGGRRYTLNGLPITGDDGPPADRFAVGAEAPLSEAGDLPAGQVVQVSAYVRVSSATRAQLVLWTLPDADGPQAFEWVTLPAGTWVRLVAYAQPGPLAAVDSLQLFVSVDTAPLADGDRVDVTQFAVIRVADESEDPEYFDRNIGRVGTPPGFPGPGLFSQVKTYGATTAADLTAVMVNPLDPVDVNPAAYLTDLFTEQVNPVLDPALNQSRTFDLHLRSRTVDHRASQVVLEFASDELLLQDFGRPTDAARFVPPTTTSLVALVRWALDTAGLGAAALVEAEDAVIDSSTIYWNQGESLWDFLDAFTSVTERRLWCDERRRWHLTYLDPVTPDTGSVAYLTDLVDTLDRELWADAVNIRHEWTDPDTGEVVSKFAGAYGVTDTGENDFTRTFSVDRLNYKTAPTTSQAEALRSRMMGRGRQVAPARVADYLVTPWQMVDVSTPNVTPHRTMVSSITWAQPDNIMTITTRDV